MQFLSPKMSIICLCNNFIPVQSYIPFSKKWSITLICSTEPNSSFPLDLIKLKWSFWCCHWRNRMACRPFKCSMFRNRRRVESHKKRQFSGTKILQKKKIWKQKLFVFQCKSLSYNKILTWQLRRMILQLLILTKEMALKLNGKKDIVT